MSEDVKRALGWGIAIGGNTGSALAFAVNSDWFEAVATAVAACVAAGIVVFGQAPERKAS